MGKLQPREKRAPSPRLRGEGWGEGGVSISSACGESPSPELLWTMLRIARGNSTSPRKRGEVNKEASDWRLVTGLCI